MEPHCTPAVSTPPFNCPPLILTLSRTSKFFSNMPDNYLWWVCFLERAIKWAKLLGIRSVITLSKASRTLANSFCTAKYVMLSPISYIIPGLFHILVFAHQQYYFWDLETECGKIRICYFWFWRQLLSDRKLLFLLLRIEQRDFSKSSTTHKSTQTLSCFNASLCFNLAWSNRAQCMTHVYAHAHKHAGVWRWNG